MTEETLDIDTKNENETSDATVNNVAVDSESDGIDRPEFSDLKPMNVDSNPTDLNRLNDVQVTVSAELGRTKVPIERLLRLGVGSVFELNRSIDSPVELIAQGVPLGNGEVVVVDGNFAIRIQEIYAKP